MRKNLFSPQHILIGASVVVVILGGFFLWHEHTQTIAKRARTIVSKGTPRTTVPVNRGVAAAKTPSSGSSSGQQGGITDNKGIAPGSNPSQWIASTSGMITLKQPAANATLKSGDIISGSAKVNEVEYRLIDNQTGVVAQGSISVVNNSFSGTIHFSHQGTGGRLDIFSYDSNKPGVEINEIQVQVGF